jgi:uncharacterized damage-inducible protein DinB
MSKAYFDRSTRVLEEADSAFAPLPGMMSVAQQVAHTAHTFDWFIEGATRPEGFSTDFEEFARVVGAVTSLTAAREWFDRAHKNFIAVLGTMSDEELYSPLPAGPVMGGAPKLAIVSAVEDHTAHHRGALTVYTRLLNKVPAMPYMDM